MQRSRRRKLERLSMLKKGVPVASAILVAAPAAMAQQAGSGGLEEIVVTAQKRSESLQNVPLSIQALTTEKLEELHVSDFADYVKYMPSVSYRTFGPGFTQVYMRGVVSGDTANHSGPQPSVGTYLDEQPITTITGNLDVHIYDVERVEALAGPQGTLYGASSQAGTIRIITNKPDPSGFKAGYDLQVNTVAHGDQGYMAEGFANIPINDKAAVRLVGWYEHDAGYIDNKHGTVSFYNGTSLDNSAYVKDNYNYADTTGARAALKVNLDDHWTISPTIMAQQEMTHGSFGGLVNQGDLALTHFFPEMSVDKWYQAALTVEGRFSNFDITYAGAYLDRKDETKTDYTDYATAYDSAYHSAGGCFSCYFTDNAGNPIPAAQHITGKDGYGMVSHELRISSAKDGPFKWVVGGFWQRQIHQIEQNYLIDNLADSGPYNISVPGWPHTIWLTAQQRADEDKALFGQATYTLWNSLDLTAGIRQFWAYDSIKGFFGFSDNFSSHTGVATCPTPDVPSNIGHGPCTNLDKQTDDSGQTYRGNITYHFDPDKLVYATYSTGYRPGGVNRRADYAPYKPDYLYNYELGWKTTWLNNSLRFNGAFFHEVWKNFQFSFLGANSFTIVQNAPQATIDGVETDVNWAATDGLVLGAGLSYLWKAELDKPYCSQLDENGSPVKSCSDPAAPAGQQLPITPMFKGNLTARYSFQIAGKDSFVQAAGVYTGDAWQDLRTVEREIIGKTKAYTLVDLAAGINAGGYSWELFVTNVFDEKGEQTRTVEAAAAFYPPVYGYPSRPRTIGIKFGQKF